MWIVLEISNNKKKAVTALRCFKCLCGAFFVFEAVLVKFTVRCQSFSMLALVSWCLSKMHTHVSETGRQTEIAFWQPPLQTQLYGICFPIVRSTLLTLFFFAGVSCDACLKGNFRGRRFKCLICYDYDLCASCYESGATTTRHTTEHPMQCILTRVDYGKDLSVSADRNLSELQIIHTLIIPIMPC